METGLLGTNIEELPDSNLVLG
jgi:hypothetical protein